MAIDISVVIPTYREDPKTLKQNLGYMKEQTAFKQGRMEIILAHIPDDNVPMGKIIGNQNNIHAIPVDRRGIAYGRHVGIMYSKGKAIVNFDADGWIDPVQGVDILTKPILEGRAHLVVCDNIHDMRALSPQEADSIWFINKMLENFNAMQRTPLFGTLEAGMTFSRQAYEYVGGFSDVAQYEGFIVASKIITAFTPAFKIYIPEVKAILSPRRAVASVKYGLLNAYGNYLQQNFR